MSETTDNWIKALRNQRSPVLRKAKDANLEEDEAMSSFDVTLMFILIDLDLAEKITRKILTRTLSERASDNTNNL